MKHAKHVEDKPTPSEVSAQSKNSVGITVFALVLLMLSVAALVFWWLSSKRWMLFVSMLVFGACLFGVGLLTKSYNKRLGVVICTLALLAGILGMLDAALPAQERQLEYVSSDSLSISMLTKDNKMVHLLNTKGIIPDNVIQGNTLRVKTTPVFSKVVYSSTPIAVVE